MPAVGRSAPDATHTQSVVFKKDDWTETRARSWLKSNDMFTDGLDETENTYRFRQYDPNDNKYRYRVVTKDLPAGVSFVIGFVK